MTSTPDPTTESVRQFYDEYGWVVDAEGSGEDKSFRGGSKAFADYARASTARVLKALGDAGGAILFVGGGDMPESHIAAARKYDRIVCLDLSAVGQDAARAKLGAAAEYVVGSILDADLGANLGEGVFDAVYCAHVLYHINADNQEAAVRAMIRACKPGGRVVIVYANPASPVRVLARAATAFKARGRDSAGDGQGARRNIYYHDHPLTWFQRFADQCVVRIEPWEAVAGRIVAPILRPEIVAGAFVKTAMAFERAAPWMAVQLWQYPLIILEKRPG